MNIQYLKYAIEVATTGSITQAAKNLFIAQSNLSSAIKHLEAEIGITIFERTKTGTAVTSEGIQFLDMARPIVYQMDALKAEYTQSHKHPIHLNISTVRSLFFTAHAISDVINQLPFEQRASIRIKEGNTYDVIEDVFSGRSSMGVVQMSSPFASYYMDVINAKGLKWEPLSKGTVKVLMSENHPLAKLPLIKPLDLIPFIEAGMAENESTILPYSFQRKEAGVYEGTKILFAYDRATLLHMLSSTDAFMWSSRVHPDLLQRYGLVLKESTLAIHSSEILIYPPKGFQSATIKSVVSSLKDIVKQTD